MKLSGRVHVLVVVVLLLAHSYPPGLAAAAQATPVGAATPVSSPVRAGDWSFQVLGVEWLEEYYAERLARMERPQGIFLVVSLAITYVGASTNELDRLVAGSWFEVTGSAGETYPLAEAYYTLVVEDSTLR